MSKSNCAICFHRNICKSPRILICKNYEFGRSDAQDCYKCLKRFDCIKGIDLLLFDCGHFVDRATLWSAEEVRDESLEVLSVMKEFNASDAEQAFLALYRRLTEKEIKAALAAESKAAP